METRDDRPNRVVRQTTTQSITSINLSKKEEAIKRLNEREERLAEFKARKERENAHLRAERELLAKAKLELIEKVKQEKEERRQKTMRKISEKDKRTELLKEREKLAIAGRYRGLEMSQRLIQILERSRSSIYTKKQSSQKNVVVELETSLETQRDDILETQEGNENDDSELRESASEEDTISNVKETIRSNIILKSSITKMVDVPLQFMLNHLSQLQTKIAELEESAKKKNYEIKHLEKKILTWQTKSICIIIGLTLFVHGSGLYSQMKRKGSNDVVTCMKTLPPYLIQCFKTKRR